MVGAASPSNTGMHSWHVQLVCTAATPKAMQGSPLQFACFRCKRCGSLVRNSKQQVKGPVLGALREVL